MTRFVTRSSIVLTFLALTLVLPLGAVAALAPIGAAAFDGRPTFSEGTSLGYYVWRDGDTWHVRWTTLGARHRFSGVVTAGGGDIDSVKRIDVDSERRVLRSGRPPHIARGPRGRLYVAPGRSAVVATRTEDKIEKDGDRTIRFNTFTDDDIDGFDFEVDDDVDTLRLVLEIDGRARPAEIEIGKDNRRAAESPLMVRLR